MLASPLLGYILAFIPASAVGGWLAARGMDRTFLRSALVMAASNLVIYAGGMAWLAASLGTGVERTLALGMLPFIPGDTIKLLAAAALVPSAWHLVGKDRS